MTDLSEVQDQYLLKDGKIKLVKIQRKNGKIVQGASLYIGRRCTMGGWNLKSSIWYNPYKGNGVGIQYVEYLYNNKKLLNKIDQLGGHTLGCWCYPDKRCHGEAFVMIYKNTIFFRDRKRNIVDKILPNKEDVLRALNYPSS